MARHKANKVQSENEVPYNAVSAKQSEDDAIVAAASCWPTYSARARISTSWSLL